MSTTERSASTAIRQRASQQNGTYPRPQLVRARHASLDKDAEFAYDDDDCGIDAHWERRSFDRTIHLPFPPESPASGIGDPGIHPIVWYRIPITASDLEAAGLNEQGDRVVLHFGAVDYLADVWVDGTHVAHHKGGQTPFSADITAALIENTGEHYVVVRAEDDPQDLTMPRGKQDWMIEPHSIWYHRTTGIWRTVWIEAVPSSRVESISWSSDQTLASVHCEVELNRRPREPISLRVELEFEGECLGLVTVETNAQRIVFDVPLPDQRNGQHYEQLLWTPETPRLIDASVELSVLGETGVDTVTYYLGLRSSSVECGRFLLNDRPYFVRSVLEQGYWPESHLTPPTLKALRVEVELIKELGFNATRVHQKVEDPRFLFWADRLGLLVWGETAGAYEFSATAIERLSVEWTNIIRHNRSHPSIVVWVPFNESWGIQHAAHNPAEQAFSRALVELTRALDTTRPIISNDGWEHTDSDIWTIHDYEESGAILRARYGSMGEIQSMLDGLGPSGRRMALTRGSDGTRVDRNQPVMLTEFGGISFDPTSNIEDSWGYSAANDAADYQRRIGEILEAVNASSALSGFCYTQLTDTRQETNGLCDENRTPKLPVAEIARLVRGTA